MVTDELKIILSVTGQSAAVNHLDRVHKSVVKLDSGTIQIDGRKITAIVLDDINSMTKSGNNAPIIQLGG